MNEMESLIDSLMYEVRVYEATPGYIADDQTAYHKTLAEVDDPSGNCYVAVRHELLVPPVGMPWTNFVSSAHELPSDVHCFYSHIALAHFNWREFYTAEVPGISALDNSYRLSVAAFKLKPHQRLLRFCEIVDSDYYALRSRDSGKTWDVVIAQLDNTDEETVEQQPTYFASFTEWLKFMIAQDGWPSSPFLIGKKLVDYGIYYEPCAERRLPPEEVKTRFGDPQKLLPPVKLRTYQKMGKSIFDE